MTFETDLRARVKNDPVVNDLIGKKDGAPSIDWKERPEGFPYPSVVMEIVFGNRSQHMAGFNTFQPFRTQFRCTATDPKSASELRDAVIECITPEVVEGDTKFLRAQNIRHFGRTEKAEAGTLHHEFIDAEIWHGPSGLT